MENDVCVALGVLFQWEQTNVYKSECTVNVKVAWRGCIMLNLNSKSPEHFQ